ncbi:DH domain-containing protein [Entamoeba marina]
MDGKDDIIVWYNNVTNQNIQTINELYNGVLLLKYLQSTSEKPIQMNSSPKSQFQIEENFGFVYSQLKIKYNFDCTHDIKMLSTGDEKEIRKLLETLRFFTIQKHHIKMNLFLPTPVKQNKMNKPSKIDFIGPASPQTRQSHSASLFSRARGIHHHTETYLETMSECSFGSESDTSTSAGSILKEQEFDSHKSTFLNAVSPPSDKRRCLSFRDESKQSREPERLSTNSSPCLIKKNRRRRKSTCLIPREELNHITTIQKILGKDWSGKSYDGIDMNSVKTTQWLIRCWHEKKVSRQLLKQLEERKKAIAEVLVNEERFLQFMELLDALLTYIIQNDDTAPVTFILAKTYLKKIVNATKNFYEAIKNVIQTLTGSYGNNVPECFIDQFKNFESYAFFINLYKRLMSDYEDLMENQQNTMPLYEYVQHLQITHQTNIDSLASMPFQHVMRYKLQIDRIIDTIPSYHPLHKQFISVNTVVNKVVTSINNQYSEYAHSVELTTVLSLLDTPITKPLFGRQLISLKIISTLRLTDISNKKKLKFKPLLCIIISDALIIVSSKSLADKEKIRVEDIIYFNNMIMMVKDELELHINSKTHFLLKFSTHTELLDFVHIIDSNRNKLWNHYNRTFHSLHLSAKPIDKISYTDINFHSNAILNTENVHLVLAGIFIFVYHDISDCFQQKKPILVANAFRSKFELILNETNGNIGLMFVVSKKSYKFWFNTLSKALIWVNIIGIQMHSYLITLHDHIPVEQVETTYLHQHYVCDIISKINDNDKCIHCGKTTDFIETTHGFFMCKSCKDLCLKKNSLTSKENIVDYKTIGLYSSNQLSKSVLSLLMERGNNVVTFAFPIQSFF